MRYAAVIAAADERDGDGLQASGTLNTERTRSEKPRRTRIVRYLEPNKKRPDGSSWALLICVHSFFAVNRIAKTNRGRIAEGGAAPRSELRASRVKLEFSARARRPQDPISTNF